MANRQSAQPPSQQQRTPPEKKIGPFAGGIGVAIWLNTVDTDDGPKQFRSYVAERVMWRRFPKGRFRQRFRSPSAT